MIYVFFFNLPAEWQIYTYLVALLFKVCLFLVVTHLLHAGNLCVYLEAAEDRETGTAGGRSFLIGISFRSDESQVDISFRNRDGLLRVSDHRFFEAVAQTYNVTRAAHILYTARPNVTGRIKRPERGLAFRVDHALPGHRRGLHSWAVQLAIGP